MKEYRIIKTFLQKVTFQIGLKKCLVWWRCDLNVEEIVSQKKNCEKQSERV